MKALFTKIVFIIIFWVSAASLFAQPVKPDDKYNRLEVMIPMRDGVKLHTVIYSPKNQTEKLPFLMTRTPYGVNDKPSPEKQVYISAMVEDGYIFVCQDIRERSQPRKKFIILLISPAPAG